MARDTRTVQAFSIMSSNWMIEHSRGRSWSDGRITSEGKFCIWMNLGGLLFRRQFRKSFLSQDESDLTLARRKSYEHFANKHLINEMWDELYFHSMNECTFSQFSRSRFTFNSIYIKFNFYSRNKLLSLCHYWSCSKWREAQIFAYQ